MVALLCLLAFAGDARAEDCVNASSGIAVSCGEPGAVKRSVFEESPVADNPSEPATTPATDDQPNSGGSGLRIVIAVFAGTFLVAGLGFVLYRRRSNRPEGESMEPAELNDHGEVGSIADETPSAPSFWTYALVAFAAAIIGAGIATGATLLIAEQGPQGEQGPVGAQGPQGDPGETGDLSDLEARISELEDSVDDVSGGFNVPINRTVVDDLENLSDSISELQSQVEVICDTLNGDYLDGTCFFTPPLVLSVASR